MNKIQGGHTVWKSGNTGKWSKQIPCREKSGNFKIKKKSGNYQGILQNVKERNVPSGSFSSWNLSKLICFIKQTVSNMHFTVVWTIGSISDVSENMLYWPF